ncbi:MAG: hypothetical protein KJ717_06250 [Proteobacteria bacterium]|nr:hypothetical protein [Pseudomonadota bacterium]
MTEEQKKIRKQHNRNMDLFCILRYPGSSMHHALWSEFPMRAKLAFAEKQNISCIIMMTARVGKCKVLIIAYLSHLFKHLSADVAEGMKGRA